MADKGYHPKSLLNRYGTIMRRIEELCNQRDRFVWDKPQADHNLNKKIRKGSEIIRLSELFCLPLLLVLSQSGAKSALLFSYIYTNIKIGFSRDNKGNLEFQNEVHGALMEQMDKAMDLIKTKYLIYRISYEGISCRETPQFPVEAIRESVMNVIVHKDYSSGVSIQISMFSAYITFWNFGILPED